MSCVALRVHTSDLLHVVWTATRIQFLLYPRFQLVFRQMIFHVVSRIQRTRRSCSPFRRRSRRFVFWYFRTRRGGRTNQSHRVGRGRFFRIDRRRNAGSSGVDHAERLTGSRGTTIVAVVVARFSGSHVTQRIIFFVANKDFVLYELDDIAERKRFLAASAS